MSKKKLELTRRRVLGGLGTIGVAGAAAGLGTSAYLNDTESFEDNTIQAGTLDMSVTATVEAASSYWSSAVDLDATADGEAVSGVTIDDVKPGDWGIICFDISIGENPGYVQVSTANLSSSENGYEEPEPEDENGEGELDDAILATIWDSYDDSGDRSGLSGLDGTTNVAGGSQAESWNSSRDEGGVVDEDTHYTTLQEAYDTYSTGVTLGGSEDPIEVGSGEQMETFCLLLEIPSEVGNEVQGDSLSFHLVFDAEQVRNNGSPFAGNSTGTNTTGT
ncbi:SipW-dependent-type signal peptide-containing protein [Halolamina sp. C58]|uniref:SipW-dependent-type signal peptide-containing protein n=1 Tax=Halolamina sp. C58 TaxID=3421640 RepID=UPI003EB81A2A